MADHRLTHPTPVPECFGCKVLGLGWQGRMSAAHDRAQIRQGIRPDPTQNHGVIADQGPSRGQLAGKHVEHWDGRQDAKVLVPTVVEKRTIQERR